MVVSQRLLLLATVMSGITLGGVPAHADALSDANALVLEDPGNVDVNLDYALIAEGQGQYRLALAAYERVLLTHPDNSAARRGLMRVRRILQPPSTQTFMEAGVVAQSNAEHEPSNDNFDFLGFGRVVVRDERNFGETRWRTVGSIYGEAHTEAQSLNYANARATVGPLIDLGSTLATLYPALGGAVAMLDGDFYYVDVNLSARVEGYLDGAFNWAQLRVGYRQYEDDLTADNGLYIDAVARMAKSDVFVEDDVVSLKPIIRWNDIDGTFNDGVDDFSPGKYLYGGAKLAYYRALNDRVTVGASVGVYDRYFFTDEAPDGDNRNDITVVPGLLVQFNDLFGPQTGLRFNYDYEYNDSNDPDHDYQNHIIGVAVTARR